MGSAPSSVPRAYWSRMRNTTSESCRLNAAPEAGRALTFLVSEETAAANDVCDLRRDHLVPCFVPLCYALEHASCKDRQILGIIVIELHETAATDQIAVERLQVGFHLHG